MKIGGMAAYVCSVRIVDDITKASGFARKNNLDPWILGDASNTIFSAKNPNLFVIKNEISGIKTLQESDDQLILEVGAGENWDYLVGKTVNDGWSGLELLSSIPGTVGAAPIQNIGAYGAEAADSIVEVKVFDYKDQKIKTISKEECGFSYRKSIFNSTADGRNLWVISVSFRLSKKSHLEPPFYESLQRYIDQNAIQDLSIENIRKSVVAVRAEKLPDPKVIANNGSFFKNPIIDNALFDKIKSENTNIPSWTVGDKTKLPAGWLVEQALGRGVEVGNFQTFKNNALVIVHNGRGDLQELESFKTLIQSKVFEKFGVNLEQEPLVC